MTQPAMVVLDDEPAALDELRGTLDRRYGQEYLVVCEGSTTAGLDRLARLAADDRPVESGWSNRPKVALPVPGSWGLWLPPPGARTVEP